MKNYLLVGISFFVFLPQLAAQNNTIHKKRLVGLVGATGITYVGTMVGLGTIWYQDMGKFHFFNDNDGWGYMDKIGHLTTAQHIGRVGIKSLAWAGLEKKKAIWYGSSLGFVFLTSVEVFDGFSKGWGFSVGDVLANTLGTALVLSQALTWNEQRIVAKWSYSGSPYAKFRPELLGSNHSERWLKDYNGQTYWLSFNLKSLCFRNSKKLPDWLNIAFGYGIEGYIGANKNPSENKKGQSIQHFERYSQFYISPDIDLSRISTKSNFLMSVLYVFNFIKVPLPGLEYNPVEGWRYRWIAF